MADRPTSHKLQRLTLLLASAGWLASCATPEPAPKPPVATPAAVSAPKPAPPPAEPPPPPPVPEGPAPGSPAAVQAAQRQAMAAAEMLEQGNEEQATAELQRAVVADPNNRLAQSLLKQIQADPLATLGRESFAYRVQPGESLSRIAQRFLGDIHQFYILARYNDIKVPRQLQGGQVIRIPGKAPPPPPAQPPAPKGAQVPPAPPPAASQADDGRAAERERQTKINAATRAARVAFARQDLSNAIRNWDIVLELDPNNTNAQLERKKAVDLRDKLGKVK